MTRSRAGAGRLGLSLVLGVMVMGVWGCGGGVRVMQDSPESGVVLYVYKGQGRHLRSSNRPEAFSKIRELCHGPYRVIQEGAMESRQRIMEGFGRLDEVMTEHWWGIRFRCEGKGGAANRTGRTRQDQDRASPSRSGTGGHRAFGRATQGDGYGY